MLSIKNLLIKILDRNTRKTLPTSIITVNSGFTMNVCNAYVINNVFFLSARFSKTSGAVFSTPRETVGTLDATYRPDSIYITGASGSTAVNAHGNRFTTTLINVDGKIYVDTNYTDVKNAYIHAVYPLPN